MNPHPSTTIAALVVRAAHAYALIVRRGACAGMSAVAVLTCAQAGSAAVTNVTSGGLFSSIAGAVAAAQAGDQLLASTGTYAESGITINKDLDLLGGYDLSFSVPVPPYFSIISATSGGGVSFLNVTGTLARFVVANHPDFGLLFDGATVLVESCSIEYHQGLDGGVALRGGAQVGLSLSFVRHCTGDTLAGGGATVNEGCTLTLMNSSVVHNNWAPRGGGVRVYPNATLNVGGSAGIRNNAAATDGGGIYAAEGAQVLIDHGIVGEAYDGNVATNSGGGIYATGASVILKNGAIVRQNLALNLGGGICAFNATVSVLANSIVGDFVTNQANHAVSRGGGMYAENGTLVVDSSMLWCNVSRTSSGGGCALRGFVQAFFTNAMIEGNRADTFGGGIYLGGAASAWLTDSLISNNISTGLGGGAGIFVNTPGQCDINDSNLVDNHSAYSGGGLQVQAGAVQLERVPCRANTAVIGGGALVNIGGTLGVRDCIVAGNAATYGGGLYASAGVTEFSSVAAHAQIIQNDAYLGGGICLFDSAVVRLNATNAFTLYLQNNHAVSGGGIYAASTGSLAVIGAMSITLNSADKDGGGMYATNATVVLQQPPMVAFPLLGFNQAGGKGGAACVVDGVCAISGAMIDMNRAAHGGGLFLDGGLVSNCIVWRNVAGEVGGGLRLEQGATAQWCQIMENSATNFGGGVSADEDACVLNCVITNNSAVLGAGGGIVCHDPNPAAAVVVRNCLIAHNRASGAWLDGGGLLDNCTIADNTPLGVIMTDGGTVRNSIAYFNAGENVHAEGLGPSVEFSCATPLLSLLGGEGCISNDPQFAGPADFHLLTGSPCIDAGTNLPWMADATDLDGNPRSVDGLVDMGCYEFVPEPAGVLLPTLCAVLRRRRGAAAP